MEDVFIYMPGSIASQQERYEPEKRNATIFWEKNQKEQLLDVMQKVFPEKNITIYNPNTDLIEPSEVFDYQMQYIKRCLFMICNLEEKRGLGVGAELQQAKNNYIPVYAVVGKKGYKINNEEINGELSYYLTKYFLDYNEFLLYIQNEFTSVR